MRYAFFLGYVGEGFHGLVRQPGLRTVEGELLQALKRLGYIESEGRARSIFSSRTDKGVSALQNVWAVSLNKEPVLGQINAELDGIWLYGFVRVPERFNPHRHVLRKWYRYVFPRRFDGSDLQRIRRAAELLVGEHDFRSFCAPEGKKTVRRVDGIAVFNQGMTVMDVFARGFLRQQVRRMAYALFMVGEGVWSPGEVERRLRVYDPVPPMPAEGLVLVRTYMDTHVQVDDEQLGRMLAEWEERRISAKVRADVFGTHRWFSLIP